MGSRTFPVSTEPAIWAPGADCERIVASLDRKRLGAEIPMNTMAVIRGVFDKETRRKPLAFAADAVSYGI
jgi:hypothetical protein